MGRFPLLYARDAACYTDYSEKRRMTNQHPLTPPPELVQQWVAAWESSYDEEMSFAEFVISRAARRPKPPSLKEQALETLKYPKDFWSEAEVDTIRLALEQLDD